MTGFQGGDKRRISLFSKVNNYYLDCLLYIVQQQLFRLKWLLEIVHLMRY